ncbi:PepSY domain-containing protein [Dyella sp. C11]|uniref:PepSY domain-containing protein n=1 Tax=Dyella sp. C11 TaxID=2126991 RepID=UPI000D645712|nr:PepSY domain-containing protein [Dyella sp. C11]
MKTLATLTVTMALVFSGVALAQQAMTEPQVKASLEQRGYSKVHDLNFKDGVWTAKARSADDRSVDVRIDPRTGQIFPDKQVARLSEADIRAQLSTQGYTHVHAVDFKDGVWKAKADNPAGKGVALQLNPNSGQVIGSDRD